MHKIISTFFIIIFSFWINQVSANLKVEQLVAGGVSWDGGSYSYPGGSPNIIVQKITTTRAQGYKDFHCHITPLAAYVVKGSVEVVKKTGETKKFMAGDAFIEVNNVWHAGNFAKDTEIIVFYSGNTVIPNSIKPNGNKQLVSLCK